jgi:hypothetical protein
MVNIGRSHRPARGSIPRPGDSFLFFSNASKPSFLGLKYSFEPLQPGEIIPRSGVYQFHIDWDEPIDESHFPISSHRNQPRSTSGFSSNHNPIYNVFQW